MNSDDAPGNLSFSPRALLHADIQRLSAQSAHCKLWSVILSAVVLLFAAGRAGGELLLWAAAPILLLAVADAGYAARAGVLRSASLKSTTKNGQDLINVAFASSDMGDMVRSLAGFTVLPFYGVLLGMVGGLGAGVIVPKTKPAAAVTMPAGMNSSPFGQGMPQAGTPFTMPPTTSGNRPQIPSSDTMPAGMPAPGAMPGNTGSAPVRRVTPDTPASSLLLNKTRPPTLNNPAPRPPVLTPPGSVPTGSGRPSNVTLPAGNTSSTNPSQVTVPPK